MELARRIHRSLLPDRFVSKRVDIDTRYCEMQLLGGDYATVYEHKPNRIFLCVCDVTGHGVAAALLAGRVNSFVRDMVKEADHPCQVVTELNSFIFRHFNGLGVFVTFHCFEINLISNEICYVGCAHPPALLYHVSRNQCEKLKSQHEIIGLSPEFSEGCRIDRASFSSGDRLLLYTDGVIETRNSKGDCFGIEGIESFLKTADASESSSQLLDRLFKELQGFRSGEPKDDILVAAVNFL